jgi:hypothetical protein
MINDYLGALEDVNRDGKAELLTLSDDGVLSILAWETGALSIKAQYSLRDISGSLLFVEDVDRDGKVEILAGGGKHRLGLYRWDKGTLYNLGQTEWSEDISSAAYSASMGLVIVQASGRLNKVKLLRSDYVRVMVGDKEYSPVAPPIIKDGRVYISARDAAALFKIGVGWDAGLKLTTITSRGVTFGFKTDSTEYYIGLKKAKDHLEAAPINSDGKLFLPLRVLMKLFGVRADWQPNTRVLKVEP